MNNDFPTKAFTLIELLVVIAIISLLSSVVLASLSGARESARHAQAEQEMNEIIDLIVLAQGNEVADLRDITGSNHTEGSYEDDPTTQSAEDTFRAALVDIYAAANKSTSTLDALVTDPWGSAYGLDENEGEYGDCRRRDRIQTFGPDQADDGGDDVDINIPFGRSCI